MPLITYYITNNLDVARAAEQAGVDRIWVDLETIGKEERQKNFDSVKSKHSIEDVQKISQILTKSKMMVRINPWNENSCKEIDDVVVAGGEYIMLPMWKTKQEVEKFILAVNGRAKTMLLLETREADECLIEVLKLKGIDEIHIGLNDLHISYGLTFMFELMVNGIVESIVERIRKTNIPFGIGGISHLGDGKIPAERIIIEHYRLGSTRAILSRGFCNQMLPIEEIKTTFNTNMKELREFEKTINISMYENNQKVLKEMVYSVVEEIKNAKRVN